MRRQWIGLVVSVVLLGVIPSGGCVAARAVETPIEIETGVAQLFVDDFLIESQSGLKRTLHQPEKDRGGNVPVIAAKEGTSLLAYGTIVHDPGLKRYVMFVQEFPSRKMYRCTSPDGLAWEQGPHAAWVPITFDLDLEREEGARGHFGIDVFSCYYDKTDRDYPYQGWLYFANCGNSLEGIHFVRSRDGKTWERGRQIVNAFAGPDDPSRREIHQDGRVVYGPGDVTLFTYDEKTDRFLGLFKFFTTTAVAPGNHLRSRAYAFFDKLDEPFDTNRIERIALLPPVARANGDMPFDEYYATTAWRHESCWLGGLKVWHSKDDYPHSTAGCAFLKLVVSRDGLNWKKVAFNNDAGVPEVFIPNGPEGGHNERNDGGYISEFSQGPLRIGDELIYYYSASSYGKNHPRDKRLLGGGIFRARLRIDGFVSVDGGTVTTRPLAFEGRDLSVNAVGPVTVEVLDAGGDTSAAARVLGDSLRHKVTFDGKTLRQMAPDGRVRLRFRIGGKGRLYSFTVR